MAATDMKLAGLEPGCKVIADHFCYDDSTPAEPQTGVVLNVYPGGAEVLIDEGQPAGGKALRIHSHDLVRDYEDAQAARQKRYAQLHEHYPGDAGVPEETDTIERYVGIEKDDTGAHAYVWGDWFEDVADQLGDDVLDAWDIEAVFDLDTGRRIEVHVASPVVSRSEDQGVCINVLEAGAAEDHAQHVEQNYVLTGYNVMLKMEVPAEAQVWCQRVADLANQAEKHGVKIEGLFSQPVRQHKLTMEAQR